MKSKQIFFFVTFADISPLLKMIDEVCPANYYRAGLFDEKIPELYQSSLEIEGLGFTEYGDWSYTKKFLLLPKKCLLTIREVPQKIGGLKYAIDQAANPDSVVMSPGGILQTKEKILVAGKVGTISDSAISLDYFKKFNSFVKKFKRYGSFYVGKEAEEKLRSGWRLVTDERRSQEYDLKVQ